MFNHGNRNNITYERELCDCSCIMFDRKVNNNREGAAQDRDSALTVEDFNGSRNSLSGSIEQLSRKISISDVKRRKVKREDQRKESELKNLLSQTPSEMKPNIQTSWSNLTPKMALIST